MNLSDILEYCDQKFLLLKLCSRLTKFIVQPNSEYLLQIDNLLLRITHHGDHHQIKLQSETSVIIYYFYRGLLHRDNDKPAIIIFNHRNQVIEKSYYLLGLLHRDYDAPAIIKQIDKNIHHSYYQRGLLHRDNGYAFYEMNNDKLTIKYYFRGKLHALKHAAVIVYRDKQSYNSDVYCRNNCSELDSWDQPYHIGICNINSSKELYYVHGVQKHHIIYPYIWSKKRGMFFNQIGHKIKIDGICLEKKCTDNECSEIFVF